MIDYWRTPDYKKLSDQNTENKKQQKIKHTAGSKSYMNHGAEIQKRTNKPASLVDIYKKTHCPSDPLAGQNISQMEELERKAAEDGMTEESTSQLDGDIYSRVMGPEKSGRYRGVGIGVKVSTVRGGSSSNANQAKNNILRQEILQLHQEREDCETIREELKREMHSELQKNRDEMQKSMQAMMSLLTQHIACQINLPMPLDQQ